MNKADILSELSKYDIIGPGRVIVKELDYSTNSLSPEKKVYRIHYSDCSGNRRKATYYPNTVGFQWS